MDDIVERLTRIETKITQQCDDIKDIRERLFGNGREGICDRVTRCEESTESIWHWINKHEKNMKFYVLLGISVIGIIQGIVAYFL